MKHLRTTVSGQSYSDYQNLYKTILFTYQQISQSPRAAWPTQSSILPRLVNEYRIIPGLTSGPQQWGLLLSATTGGMTDYLVPTISISKTFDFKIILSHDINLTKYVEWLFQRYFRLGYRELIKHLIKVISRYHTDSNDRTLLKQKQADTSDFSICKIRPPLLFCITNFLILVNFFLKNHEIDENFKKSHGKTGKCSWIFQSALWKQTDLKNCTALIAVSFIRIVW